MKYKLSILFTHLETKNHFTVYFSYFKIFVGIIIFKDIFYSWHYSKILYEGISFVSVGSSSLESFYGLESYIRQHIPLYFALYAAVTTLFVFRIGGHFTAILVFLFYDISQRLSPMIQNGGDNILKFVLMYMIFTNVPNDNSKSRISNVINNLAGYSIQMHLCLAYFLSAIHKIHSDAWFNGIATYYILSLERFRGTSWNLVLAKNGIFVTVTTYGTILVELLLPILIWFKQTRGIIVVLGVLLHTGIFYFMMIHDFQLIFISLYGFFFTNDELLSLQNQVVAKTNHALKVLKSNKKTQ
jgi:hypothetical protein